MTLYFVLGLDRTASETDIKRAFKRLARRYHPDINPGDRTAGARFKRIAEAYETLSDPDRRRRYDAGDEAAPAGPITAFGFEGFDFTVGVNGESAPTFGDLFADALHPRPARDERPERGADLHHSITVSFEDSILGGRRPVGVMRQVHCRACQGAGVLHTAESRCEFCHGAGVVKSARGHMVFSKPCLHCGGTGSQQRSACPTCRGQKAEMQGETLMVNVPSGLADGARIRVPGKGHAGRNGGESGDLYLTVHVEPHAVFRREGDDVHVTVPVAIHEAALGAKIEVPSLDGPARVRVPPGTQSGHRFRLRERGVRSPRSGRRGDLVVETRLVLPTLLDERSKELLREFGRINSEDVRKPLMGPSR